METGYHKAITATLADIANEFSSTRDWESHVQNALDLICMALPAVGAALGVMFGGWRFLSCKLENSEEVKEALSANYSFFSGVCLYPEQDGNLLTPGAPRENALVMPVTGADDTLGILHLEFPDAQAYSLDDVQAVAVVAALLGSYLRSVEAAQMEVSARQEAEQSRDELIRAYEALRVSEARLRLATDTTQFGAFDYRPQTGELIWSDYAKEHFGLPPDAEVDYDTFLKGLHPDDRERVLSIIENALRPESGGEYATDYRTIGIQDGKERWLQARGRVFFYEQGKPTQLIGGTLDITERKRIEEALRSAREEAERRAEEAEEGRRILEALMEYIPEGITIADAPDVHIRMVSAYGRRLLERPINGITGIPVGEHVEAWDIYCPDGETRPSGDELPLSRVVQKGEVVTDEEWVVRTGSGKKVTISASTGPIRDNRGNITGAIIAWRDVTERKQIEQQREELLQREHHIAEILQQALVPINVISSVGDYNIAVGYRAAWREAEVGGDFYDVFELGEGRVGLLIGDVGGKGLNAAVRVAAARYSVRDYAYLGLRTGKVMEFANDSLYKDKPDEGGELTALFAVLDINSGTITYTSGGHEPPLLAHSDSHIEELACRGMMMSVISGVSYQECSFTFRPGDRLIAVTDGITEARDENVELFGKSGMLEYIRRNPMLSAQELVDGLLDAATAHAGGRLQDDAAVMIVEQR